ncbi:MAG: NAD(P)H-hydrate dehydratase [Saccharofermentanales bacterium]
MKFGKAMIMWTIGRAQQQALDSLIEQELGISVAVLMEYAGVAVARTAKQLLHKTTSGFPIHILCGHGQNAGDALVAARLLTADGYAVFCYLDGSSTGTAEFFAQLKTVQALGIPCLSLADFAGMSAKPALVIDGVFGTGFQTNRPLAPEIAASFRQAAAVRAAGGLVLAIDLPSGLSADTSEYVTDAIKADATVTFLYPKTGLVSDPGRDLAGEISVDRLSVPAAILDSLLLKIEPNQRLPELIEPAEIRFWAPQRPRRLHKTQSGRMLLVAGGPGLGGAALLAGEAALRSGAGLLNILTDESITTAILTRMPEAMVQGVNSNNDQEALARLNAMFAKEPKAVGIGPGLLTNEQSAVLLELVIRQAPKLVIDAGAITIIAADQARFVPLLQARASASTGSRPAVLTPHPGEFRRLAPELTGLPRHEAAARLADKLNCVIVLKGAATVIAAPQGRIMINNTGNTGLASGGSGDVLTGLLLGFLAQGMEEFPAAVSAVYLHGSAADLAVRDSSARVLIPSDLVRSLPAVFRLVGWESATSTLSDNAKLNGGPFHL